MLTYFFSTDQLNKPPSLPFSPPPRLPGPASPAFVQEQIQISSVLMTFMWPLEKFARTFSAPSHHCKGLLQRHSASGNATNGMFPHIKHWLGLHQNAGICWHC